MDLKNSNEFSAASAAPQGQMHNFMPMPSFSLSPHNNPQDGGDQGRDCGFMQLLKQNIDLFWSQRLIDILNTSDLKSQHQLPLARIKKIMKSDQEVKMISADTPILFAKACELFVLELTIRSWLHTQENRRRTLQRCDIVRAIRNDDVLDFLVDVVHEVVDDHQGETNGNNLEGAESDPSIQMHLPLLNTMNGAFGVRNYQDASHQFMIQPSVSSFVELNHERPRHK